MHPFQQDCDPENPQQHAAWCWAAGVPDPAPARPVPIPLIPPQLAAGISEMLWNFGFRHHPELQTRWIEGSAGLGMLAKIVDSAPVSNFSDLARQFLAEKRPDILEEIDSANSSDERAELISKYEKSIDGLQGIIAALRGSG